MRLKKEQLYLLIFIVALTLAIVKIVSLSGRVGLSDPLLLVLAGIGIGGATAAIAGAMRRELVAPVSGAPTGRSERGARRARPREGPRARSPESSARRPARSRPAAASGGRGGSGGQRKTGTVKWFNNAKGFGFISPDNGDEDCFVHRSAVDGAEGLPEGARVEYEVVRDDRGRNAAANVRVS